MVDADDISLSVTLTLLYEKHSIAYVFFRKKKGKKGSVHSSKSVGRCDLGNFQISSGNRLIKSCQWKNNMYGLMFWIFCRKQKAEESSGSHW